MLPVDSSHGGGEVFQDEIEVVAANAVDVLHATELHTWKWLILSYEFTSVKTTALIRMRQA